MSIDINKIKSYLCYYDKRNPSNDPEWTKPEDCYCDNCTCGHNALALEMLSLKAKADLLDEAIKVLTANCEQCPATKVNCLMCKKYAIVLKHEELNK